MLQGPTVFPSLLLAKLCIPQFIQLNSFRSSHIFKTFWLDCYLWFFLYFHIIFRVCGFGLFLKY